MKTNDGGLAAVLYGPSKVTTTVGPDKQQIAITQTTRYPFEEQIHFKIDADRPVTFLYPCAYRRGARHRVSPSMALPLRLLGTPTAF